MWQINILGDPGNIAFWWANPDSRLSLNSGILATTVGMGNALLFGTVILTAVSVIYFVSLVWLLKNMIWAPYVVIGISVINRVFGLVIYLISSAFIFWAVWTIILFVASCLNLRSKPSSVTPPTTETKRK